MPSQSANTDFMTSTITLLFLTCLGFRLGFIASYHDWNGVEDGKSICTDDSQCCDKISNQILSYLSLITSTDPFQMKQSVNLPQFDLIFVLDPPIPSRLISLCLSKSTEESATCE